MTQPAPPASFVQGSLYRHSGKVPPAAFLFAFLLSLAAAALICWIYGPLQFLLELVPYAKLRAMLVLLLIMGGGICLGTVPTFLLTRLKGRSVPAALLLAAITCLVAYYFAWAGWFYAYFDYVKDPAPAIAMLNPAILFPLISELYEKGFTPFVGDPATGPLLGLTWAIEFGGMVAAACVYAKIMMNARVFCETCQAWGIQRPLMKLQDPGTPQRDTFIKQLTQGDLTSLSTASAPAAAESSWLQTILEGCPNCDNLQTLSIDRFQIIKNKKGKTQNKTHLLRRLLLTPDQTVTLAQTAASLTPLPAQPPSAAP